MSQIESGKTESNRVKNRESNQVGNGESDPVGNGESNPVGNGESNQVIHGELNQVKNDGQRRTAISDYGDIIRYLTQQWAGY